jgi:hypothetical protein
MPGGNLLRWGETHTAPSGLRRLQEPVWPSPHAPNQLTGHGHDDLVGLFPPCHQAAGALAQSHLGFPAEVLDHCGWFFQSELEMSADCGWGAGGPGACYECATRRRITSFRERPLPASLPRGRLCGDQPQACHELSGMLAAREVAECSDRGDRHRAWHATQGLEGFDHRVETPDGDRFLACLFQTLEAVGGLAHGADLCLAHDVVGRCGTDPFREPAEGGCSPGGAARGAASVSAQEGCEPTRGGLELPAGICASPTQIPHGFLCNCGHINRGASP